jgi:predicted hotdog family 3-hydroxylacyl-ACP dehydratase
MVTMTDQIPSLPYEAEKLIPQRLPMRLIERLVQRDRTLCTGCVEARLAADSMFLSEDRGLMSEYLIELAAQSIAAINGYDGLVDGSNAKVGFLVGVDDWHCLALPEVEAVMTIDLRQTLEFGAIKIVHAVIRQHGQLLAEGDLKVWEGDEFPS